MTTDRRYGNRARSIAAAIGNTAFRRLQRHRTPVPVKLRKLVRDARRPLPRFGRQDPPSTPSLTRSVHGSIPPPLSRPAEYEIPVFSTNVFNSPFVTRLHLNCACRNKISAMTDIQLGTREATELVTQLIMRPI